MTATAQLKAIVETTPLAALEGLDYQLNQIEAVATAALALVASRPEPDITMQHLLDLIHSLASDTAERNALRRTLPGA